MIQISWEIGKKPRGNWLTPLSFKISFVSSEELQLNPRFIFHGKYKLPEKILLIESRNRQSAKKTELPCRAVEELHYDFNAYKNEASEQNHIKHSLNPTVCSHSCSYCRAFLPWRPGLPDYSDFEEIFKQVAHDMCDAWNRGVQEAMESLEYGQDPVIITSADYLRKKQEATELANKPVRRVKV